MRALISSPRRRSQVATPLMGEAWEVRARLGPEGEPFVAERMRVTMAGREPTGETVSGIDLEQIRACMPRDSTVVRRCASDEASLVETYVIQPSF